MTYVKCAEADPARVDPRLALEPISIYTDAEAVADGVLVPISGDGGVNRVTRAVFDQLAKPIGDPRFGVFDATLLLEAIRALVSRPMDRGWRTGCFQGWKLWLIPNEVRGFTLMFPEDY